jgi:hypothetical protein
MAGPATRRCTVLLARAWLYDPLGGQGLGADDVGIQRDPASDQRGQGFWRSAVSHVPDGVTRRISIATAGNPDRYHRGSAVGVSILLSRGNRQGPEPWWWNPDHAPLLAEVPATTHSRMSQAFTADGPYMVESLG